MLGTRGLMQTKRATLQVSRLTFGERARTFSFPPLPGANGLAAHLAFISHFLTFLSPPGTRLFAPLIYSIFPGKHPLSSRSKGRVQQKSRTKSTEAKLERYGLRSREGCSNCSKEKTAELVEEKSEEPARSFPHRRHSAFPHIPHIVFIRFSSLLGV